MVCAATSISPDLDHLCYTCRAPTSTSFTVWCEILVPGVIWLVRTGNSERKIVLFKCSRHTPMTPETNNTTVKSTGQGH